LDSIEWRVSPDLGSDDRWEAVLKGLDVVVHLAAIAHVARESAASFEARVLEVNGYATVRLAEACARTGVRRFVFLSSVKAIAERTDRPLRVDAPARPEDAYGRAKGAAEVGLARIAAKGIIDVAIVRCPLVYGLEAAGNLRALARLVNAGIPLPFGSIRNRRSLVSLETLSEAIARIATAAAPMAGTYHIADPAPYSTADIVVLVGRLAGKNARLFGCPEWMLRPLVRVAGGQGAIDRLLGSLELETADSFQRLGWSPRPATRN
jgi:UDP-glucose 4-epimerase